MGLLSVEDALESRAICLHNYHCPVVTMHAGESDISGESTLELPVIKILEL